MQRRQIAACSQKTCQVYCLEGENAIRLHFNESREGFLLCLFLFGEEGEGHSMKTDSYYGGKIGLACTMTWETERYKQKRSTLAGAKENPQLGLRLANNVLDASLPPLKECLFALARILCSSDTRTASRAKHQSMPLYTYLFPLNSSSNLLPHPPPPAVHCPNHLCHRPKEITWNFRPQKTTAAATTTKTKLATKCSSS